MPGPGNGGKYCEQGGTVLYLYLGLIMNLSDVAEDEELSEPEYTDQAADSDAISTSGGVS